MCFANFDFKTETAANYIFDVAVISMRRYTTTTVPNKTEARTTVRFFIFIFFPSTLFMYDLFF